MADSKFQIVRNVVATLGKDASAKEVLSKVKTDYSSEIWSDKTISGYYSQARKELGFSKPHQKKTETFSLDVDELVETKTFLNDCNISEGDCIKVIEYAEKVGIKRALNNIKAVNLILTNKS